MVRRSVTLRLLNVITNFSQAPQLRFITEIFQTASLSVFMLLLQHVSVNITLNHGSSSARMGCFACSAAPSLMLVDDACPVPWHGLRPNLSSCLTLKCSQGGP